MDRQSVVVCSVDYTVAMPPKHPMKQIDAHTKAASTRLAITQTTKVERGRPIERLRQTEDELKF